MTKAISQQAYILHHRPFSETSAILHCFTKQDGLINVIAKGVRRQRQAKIQLFTPYWLSYAGRSDLKQCHQLECAAPQARLLGIALSCGFYLNELILLLLTKEEGVPDLWWEYHLALSNMQGTRQCAAVLRNFEFNLLSTLGYGFQLDKTRTGEDVEPAEDYVFEFTHGIELYQQQALTAKQQRFKGSELLGMEARDWQEPTVLRAAKPLLRQAIDQVLDGKVLKTREFAKLLTEETR